LATGERVAQLGEHDGHAQRIACTVVSGTPIAVVASEAGTIRIWDLAQGRQVADWGDRDVRPLSELAWTTVRGRPVVLAASRSTDAIEMWSLPDGDRVGQLVGRSAVSALACGTLSGRPIAVVGSRSEATALWDLTSAIRLEDLQERASTVTAAACAPLGDRPVAILGTDRGAVEVWDVGSRLRIHVFSEHADEIGALAHADLDGRPVVISLARTGSTEGRHALIWELSTGRELARLEGPAWAWISSVACTTVKGRPVAVLSGRRADIEVVDLRTTVARSAQA
jgi:WD40 repeat protein